MALAQAPTCDVEIVAFDAEDKRYTKNFTIPADQPLRELQQKWARHFHIPDKVVGFEDMARHCLIHLEGSPKSLGWGLHHSVQAVPVDERWSGMDKSPMPLGDASAAPSSSRPAAATAATAATAAAAPTRQRQKRKSSGGASAASSPGGGGGSSDRTGAGSRGGQRLRSKSARGSKAGTGAADSSPAAPASPSLRRRGRQTRKITGSTGSPAKPGAPMPADTAGASGKKRKSLTAASPAEAAPAAASPPSNGGRKRRKSGGLSPFPSPAAAAAAAAVSPMADASPAVGRKKGGTAPSPSSAVPSPAAAATSPGRGSNRKGPRSPVPSPVAAAAASTSPGATNGSKDASATETYPGDEASIEFKQANPKLENTGAHARYEGYKRARSTKEALQLGATRRDIVYDFGKGYLRLS